MSVERKSVCHRYFNGEFFNPWSEKVKRAHQRCSSSFLSRAFTFRSPARDPQYPNALSTSTLDSVHGVAIFKPKDLVMPRDEQVNVVWLGHSCVLVQFDGVTVLTDPSLEDKCGSGGPKRVRKIPCKIENLNYIDFVILTSDRAEFLSQTTVVTLLKNHPDGHIRWYCGLGIAKTLETWGCTNVLELDWWDSDTFENITVHFTPAQNWSGRSGNINDTLWGSWVVKGPTKSYFHVGCTGYCQVFKTIGDELGPFSLATLPIGGYECLKTPLWYTLTPAEAVQVHQDLKSQRSVGIRWGTWVLSRESFYEPKRELEKARDEAGLEAASFALTRIGKVNKIIEGEVDLVNSIYETPRRSRDTSLTHGSTESYTRRYRNSIRESIQLTDSPI